MMRNHIMYTLKILTDLRFIEQKINKKWLCKSCLQCFSSENILIKHKEICLSVNGRQAVKLEEGIIKLENYFKQIPVPFKIYFERNLKKIKCNRGSYTEKYQYHIPCSCAYKIVCIDDRFSKPTIIYRGRQKCSLWIY